MRDANPATCRSGGKANSPERYSDDGRWLFEWQIVNHANHEMASAIATLSGGAVLAFCRQCNQLLRKRAAAQKFTEASV